MSRRCRFLIIVILLLLTACTSPLLPAPTSIGPTVTPNQNALPSLTPFRPEENTPAITPVDSTIIKNASPGGTSTLLPIAANTPPHYVLNVILDYAAHSLTVDETISYLNTTGIPLDGLVLAVEPNLWANCFELEIITANNQEVPKWELNGGRLDVPLGEALVPGETLTMSLHYDLRFPAADSLQVFGYNDRQTNLVDWYPFIVPYSGGWLLYPPAEVGEHLIYNLADYDVTLTLADPTLPAVLAASAPAETVAGSWQYHLQNARTFVLSASTAYQNISTTANNVKVTSYYFSEEKIQGKAVLDEVAKALDTYSSLFGPYPYPGLSIVESPFFDGMEYDGLFFLSRDYYKAYDGTVLNNLVDIAVHETAHQWWFGLVGNNQAMEPWLDEALATYSENLFYENNYPEITAWLSFRVYSFSPYGWVDTDIYHGGSFRSYANAVYLQGSLFLNELRGRMGDEVFLAFMKDYAHQMTGKTATADDFFRILGHHTSANIANLITEYFQHQH